MITEIEYRPPSERAALPKRIGLIALSTDATIESDFNRLIALRDVAVHVNRIEFANPTTPENLRAMQPQLAKAASLILPGEKLQAIVFGCTSASVVIGEEQVRLAITHGRGDIRVITPAGAAVDALNALNAKSITIVTPYVRQTAEPLSAYFQSRGFAIRRAVCLNMADDRMMARIPASDIVGLVCKSVEPGSDAIFVGCTAFPAAQAASQIEAITGIPVVTSNIAAAWSALRCCGVSADPGASTRLLRLA
ncbi:ectoine utilization protein EutA [Rhizobium brockwellii]|uniref:aspartate racemase/maleate isomerase family protein n=1 Tax=Rhizobium brockwellii TaxID=3019932 RepID=UPI003F970DCF